MPETTPHASGGGNLMQGIGCMVLEGPKPHKGQGDNPGVSNGRKFP